MVSMRIQILSYKVIRLRLSAKVPHLQNHALHIALWYTEVVLVDGIECTLISIDSLSEIYLCMVESTISHHDGLNSLTYQETTWWDIRDLVLVHVLDLWLVQCLSSTVKIGIILHRPLSFTEFLYFWLIREFWLSCLLAVIPLFRDFSV
jgi:hypothetical protein